MSSMSDRDESSRIMTSSATLNEWQKVFDVNSTGTFLCYREAAKSMIAHGIKGRIVGACSISGKKSNLSLKLNIFAIE